MIEALAGKKVVGVAAGSGHTAAWTEEGELFTVGYGQHGELGYGGTQEERVPRLVDALGGKKVVGAAAGDDYTAVWTEEGELFTFGYGYYGQPGHGDDDEDELCRGWSRRWQARRRLVQRQVIITQQYGPRKGSSSRWGLDIMGHWATERKGYRLSLCRGSSRRWLGRR